MTADDLARRFHETYERLAPSFGYETRRASAVPWEEVPEQNRALMTAVAAELLGADRTLYIVVRRDCQDVMAVYGSQADADLDVSMRESGGSLGRYRWEKWHMPPVLDAVL